MAKRKQNPYLGVSLVSFAFIAVVIAHSLSGCATATSTPQSKGTQEASAGMDTEKDREPASEPKKEKKTRWSLFEGTVPDDL